MKRKNGRSKVIFRKGAINLAWQQCITSGHDKNYDNDNDGNNDDEVKKMIVVETMMTVTIANHC